jgi:hypothetical protein
MTDCYYTMAFLVIAHAEVTMHRLRLLHLPSTTSIPAGSAWEWEWEWAWEWGQ